MKEHCPEHELRGERLTKAEACIDNFKYNWNSGRQVMADRAAVMEAEIKNKLNATTFYKIISILITIMVLVVGANWKMMLNIDDKVDGISIKQAVVVEKLEHLNFVDRSYVP